MRSNTLRVVEKSLKQLAKRFGEKHGNVEIYLFGSFAKGDWLEDSDVDIAVISSAFEGKPMSKRVDLVRRLASLRLSFEIFAYTPEELRKALKESIAIQDASTYWKKIA
jgi:hypothetical protein